MSTIRACAWGERSTAACRVSAPDGDVVDVAALAAQEPLVLDPLDLLAHQLGRHAPSPVEALSSARSSNSSCPASGSGGSGAWTCCAPSLRDLRGPLDRLHDVLVAGAAAQVAGDHVAGLVVGGRGVVAQPGGDRGQEAGRAEAALQPVALEERLLHRAERAVRLGEPLDGGDLASVGRDREHQAGAHRPAVDQHRAGAAHAVLAADVGAGEAEVVAQRVGEQPPGRHAHRVRGAVDGQHDVVPLLAHALAPSRADRTTRAVRTRTSWAR